ncbi:hypothetical protein [Aliikangiella coralliicola]|uniref:DUF2306 domain-containing protein n=1 Tax=Aliikangiella coralliicola TaxID=2592383 RepID=A0A545UJ40_9GAMM|nr:hypothetical protein [Aliikangiella coralliicola]TQV89481.1 hypothetical protein FLL46_00955 [Aliikangiella coralliicola]
MPEISTLGWIHTFIGAMSLASAFFCLIVYKNILENKALGIFYLGGTFITATTSLFIYQHGVFGPAHVLAVLTLLSLTIGYCIRFIPRMVHYSPYIKSFCYSLTVLFHIIPAVTEGLLRLPANKPFVTDQSDPFLAKVHGVLFLVFIVGYICQYFWLRRHFVQTKKAH